MTERWYPRSRRGFFAAALVCVAATLTAGCGSNSTADSASRLYVKAGCAACHGSEGKGGVGPALTDVYGSNVEVTNSDGETTEVFADGEYLRRSITDPDAEKVTGYTTKMPKANLSDEQVEELVIYIESLSSVPPDVTAASQPDVEAE